MSLGVASLSTTENLPVAILTPIAEGLNVTTGMAGQALTASAISATVAALTVAVLTRNLDRRILLLSLTVLQVIANLIMALAPNLATVLVGRVLVGIAVGGFWSMSAALALRLVPTVDVPKALAIVFGGSSVAGIAAAPLGSLLGGVIGWRGVFWAATALSVVALSIQLPSLPSMPPQTRANLGTFVVLLRRPAVLAGLAGIMLTFGGHRFFFGYVRAMLDQATNSRVGLISGLLLLFGVASFIGTTRSGRLHSRNMNRTMTVASATIAVLALVMIPASQHWLSVIPVLFFWGVAFGMIPVGWSTWITRAVADHAESAGGLQVAIIQLAFIVASGLGGVVVDRSGVSGILVGTAVIMALAAVHIHFLVRPANPPLNPDSV